MLGVSKGISKKVDSQIAGSYWGRKIERMKMRRIEYARIRDMMQAQLQAEMEKEKAYYAQHKMSVWDLFTKGPPPPQSETNSP